jgi:hypothetical protein
MYHTVGTVPISEKAQKEAKSLPLTQILDFALFWLGTGISIKSDGSLKMPKG